MCASRFLCAMVALLCIPFLSCSSDGGPVDEDYEIVESIDASIGYVWGASDIVWIEAQPLSGLSDPECCHKYKWKCYGIGSESQLYGRSYSRVVRYRLNNRKGEYSFSEETATNRYVRYDGNKVYGLDAATGEEVLFHDFSTLQPGGEIAIGSFPTGGGELYPERIPVTELERHYLSPRGRVSYDCVNGGYDYLKFVGKINDGYGMFGYGDVDADNPVVPGTIILLAYDRNIGVVFMHPDFHKIEPDCDHCVNFILDD